MELTPDFKDYLFGNGRALRPAARRWLHEVRSLLHRKPLRGMSNDDILAHVMAHAAAISRVHSTRSEHDGEYRVRAADEDVRFIKKARLSMTRDPLTGDISHTPFGSRVLRLRVDSYAGIRAREVMDPGDWRSVRVDSAALKRLLSKPKLDPAVHAKAGSILALTSPSGFFRYLVRPAAGRNTREIHEGNNLQSCPRMVRAAAFAGRAYVDDEASALRFLRRRSLDSRIWVPPLVDAMIDDDGATRAEVARRAGCTVKDLKRFVYGTAFGDVRHFEWASRPNDDIRQLASWLDEVLSRTPSRDKADAAETLFREYEVEETVNRNIKMAALEALGMKTLLVVHDGIVVDDLGRPPDVLKQAVEAEWAKAGRGDYKVRVERLG